MSIASRLEGGHPGQADRRGLTDEKHRLISMPTAILLVPLHRSLPPERIYEGVRRESRSAGWDWTARQTLQAFPDRRDPAPSIKHGHSGGDSPNVTNFRWKSLRHLGEHPKLKVMRLWHWPALNPDSLYAALDATEYAAFVKESRNKRAGATKLHRKSGEARDQSRTRFTER